MSESASPEPGPLSVDQAVASLLPEPAAEETETPEAPLEAAEGEEIVAGDQPAEEPEGEPETPAEGEEEPEAEAAAPLDAPVYWSKEAKAKFASLDPELQAVVLSQEGPREEATAKAKSDAAKQTEAANAELGKVNELAAALADRLPKWIETFASRWGTQTPDWVAVAQEHGVEAMTLAKTQFEAERQQLQDAAAETAKAQQIAHQTFLTTEWKALAELSPELAPDASDPTKGADKRKDVVNYLAEYGIPRESIAQISAREMTLARKAMLYDEAQAALKAAPKPKPAAVPAARAPVRPAAAQAQPSSQRTATQVANRFAQTRSVDDAVALLLASKG